MSIRGWVYIITNKAMPGLLKVGYSTKDPQLRAIELNNTGSPLPYFVEYDVLVTNPKAVESKIHNALRNNLAGKEWFRCTVKEAIEKIRLVVNGDQFAERFSNVNCEPECKETKPVSYRNSSYCYGCHTLVKFDTPTNEKTVSVCPKCGRVVRPEPL